MTVIELLEGNIALSKKISLKEDFVDEANGIPEFIDSNAITY